MAPPVMLPRRTLAYNGPLLKLAEVAACAAARRGAQHASSHLSALALHIIYAGPQEEPAGATAADSTQ